MTVELVVNRPVESARSYSGGESQHWSIRHRSDRQTDHSALQEIPLVVEGESAGVVVTDYGRRFRLGLGRARQILPLGKTCERPGYKKQHYGEALHSVRLVVPITPFILFANPWPTCGLRMRSNLRR